MKFTVRSFAFICSSLDYHHFLLPAVRVCAFSTYCSVCFRIHQRVNLVFYCKNNFSVATSFFLYCKTITEWNFSCDDELRPFHAFDLYAGKLSFYSVFQLLEQLCGEFICKILFFSKFSHVFLRHWQQLDRNHKQYSN